MKWFTPEWYDEVNSTNSLLTEKVLSGEFVEDGMVLAAYRQKDGRGRLGRKWSSQPDRDLTFSFLLCGQNEFPKLASLPMAVSLGVVHFLKQYGIVAKTKWPNDVLVNNRKICGVLAERVGKDTTVVGVGLNVNMDSVNVKAVGRPASSMYLETDDNYNLEVVLVELLESLNPWICHWRKAGFAALRGEWLQTCVYIGEKIKVGEESECMEGILDGFGAAGQLLLRSSNGELSEIWAGNVTK